MGTYVLISLVYVHLIVSVPLGLVVLELSLTVRVWSSGGVFFLA